VMQRLQRLLVQRLGAVPQPCAHPARQHLYWCPPVRVLRPELRLAALHRFAGDLLPEGLGSRPGSPPSGYSPYPLHHVGFHRGRGRWRSRPPLRPLCVVPVRLRFRL
jgi:hypothetical protein